MRELATVPELPDTVRPLQRSSAPSLLTMRLPQRCARGRGHSRATLSKQYFEALKRCEGLRTHRAPLHAHLCGDQNCGLNSVGADGHPAPASGL